MTSIDVPTPRFQHFECVSVTADDPHNILWQGKLGVVVWLDSSLILQRLARREWQYIVHFPEEAAWKAFCESDLTSNGRIESETAFLATRPEISFDTVVEKDNQFVEGSFRLPGKSWEVVIVMKKDVADIEFRPTRWRRPTKWEREATGVVIRFPRTAVIGREELLNAMTQFSGCHDWTEVRGPDSVVLR